MNALHLDGLAYALDGDAIPPNEVHAPGPGKQISDRSLLVKFGTYGLEVYSFAGDSFETCRAHVASALGSGATTHIFPVHPGEISLRWWREAGDIRGTLAEHYLESQGLIPGETRVFNDVRKQLKFHPSCPFDKGHAPCLLALERKLFYKDPIAVIRIGLDSNGNSIGRLFAVKGGVVKFRHSDNVEELTICETLEASLAGLIAGFSPVWSVGGGLDFFRSIRGVKLLKILVNEDSPELRSVLKNLTRDWKPKIELFALATNTNLDGSASIAFSPIQPETPSNNLDDVHKFFLDNFFKS